MLAAVGKLGTEGALGNEGGLGWDGALGRDAAAVGTLFWNTVNSFAQSTMLALVANRMSPSWTWNCMSTEFETSFKLTG